MKGNTAEHFRYIIESNGCCCAEILCRYCSIFANNGFKEPTSKDCTKGAWDILEQDFPEVFLELKLRLLCKNQT